DARRWPVERRVRTVEDAGPVEDLVRALRALDVELEARRLVERPAPVGANLGGHSQRAQERARAAGDGRARRREIDGDAAPSPEMCAAGDVEEPGELGEPV